ncbi:MAG: PLP-dependent aminotransferase family protein [Verrucomicrobia bacterium]|nr:PLP-dependent aminotransferase family protein [Verrucomicrobiota bacterium]
MQGADTGSQSSAQPTLLYEQVTQQITQLIQQGTLRPGDRIPSVRKLVRQKSVSVATVLQAYQLLESRGLIEARPQSGFYVRVPRWTPPPEPETFCPAGGLKKLNMAGLVMEVVGTLNQPGLINLGAAVPPPELLPTRELHRALAGATRRHPALANVCDPSIGLRSLRVEIAKRAVEAGCSLAPDEIIITNGATEALHLCLRAVTRPGDAVAIESPTYFGILQIIEMLGLRACEIPTHPKEGVCLDELARRLTRARIKACVFMTNFSNPLGSCLPDAKKRRLVELLKERGVPLIEDDIYGSLAFGPARPAVAKSFDREGLVLLCSSLGKTVAPGYRVGWAVPGKFKAEVHRLKHTCSIGNPTVTQLALADFLATGGYERHLRRLRRTYSQLAERMSGSIARHFPAGTRVTRPEGGQVLWVELQARRRPGQTRSSRQSPRLAAWAD